MTGPSPEEENNFEDKYVHINNTLIVGRSHDFDCSTDILDSTPVHVKMSKRMFKIDISGSLGGFVGVVTPSFVSDVDEEDLFKVSGYNSIGGSTHLNGKSCNTDFHIFEKGADFHEHCKC